MELVCVSTFVWHLKFQRDSDDSVQLQRSRLSTGRCPKRPSYSSYAPSWIPIRRGSSLTTLTNLTSRSRKFYRQRQCQFMYPKKFKKPPIINVGPTNAKYKGWRVRKNRLFFANGVRDPWREATVSAQGIEVASTSQMPVAVSNGFHCTDLSVARGAADPTVRAVQQEALRSMNGWLKEEWEPKVGFGGAPERERARLYEDGVPPRSGAGDKPVNAWVKDFGDQV